MRKFYLCLVFTLASADIHSSVTIQENNLDDSITQLFNRCTCTIFYQCDEQNFIIPEEELQAHEVSSTITNLRTIRRIRCSNHYYYCCKPRTDAAIKPVILSEPVSVRACGLGDSEAGVIGKFPWVVSLSQRKNNGQYAYKCGGSLIHSKVVLTAQHCVVSSQPETLRITGSCNLVNPTHKSVTRTVTQIIKHPDYYSGALYNDIALVILAEPIDSINPICLPEAGDFFNGKRCDAAGWGNSIERDRNEALRQVNLPIVDNRRCLDLLQRTALGPDFQLHGSFICAGGEEGKDTCSGDGGGPLMCWVNNRYVQAGIVSWGLRCGLADVPSLYTRTTMFVNWIKRELEANNLRI